MNAWTNNTMTIALLRILALFIVVGSLSVPPTKCTIKICHNKDCTKKGGGASLVNTFRDLLPAPSSPGESEISIESSGCLSQCGKGPNVCVDDGEKEKMYFGVEDPTTASAVLDVATGDEFPINLLVAATSIYEAEQTTSPSKRESLLSSAISAVTKDGDATLAKSFAHAHALYLRADARLDLSPPNIDGATEDVKLACKLAPAVGKAWRVMACVLEAGGDVKGAIGALDECMRADPSFATKATREMERLASLL